MSSRYLAHHFIINPQFVRGKQTDAGCVSQSHVFPRLFQAVRAAEHCRPPGCFPANGAAVDWVEDYAWRKGWHRHQLVLWYGCCLGPGWIKEGVRRLAAVLNGSVNP